MTGEIILLGTKRGPAIRQGGTMPTASLLRLGGKSAFFSAATRYFPPLGKFASGADVLVHETMLTAGVDKLVARTASARCLREHPLAAHAPAEDVGRIASAGMVGTPVLNPLVAADDPDFGETDWRDEVSRTWNGPLIVGRDGLAIPLTRRRR